jgi:hypothetical protein
MIRNALHVLAAAAAVSLASTAAHAVPGFGSASPTKANGDFIAGNGIAANGFTIDTALTGESVALKARDRNTSQPILQVANRYFVPQGMATATRAAWNFDMQFSPGAAGNANPAAYTYEIQADINPAFGVATFQTIPVPPSVQGVPVGDSYFPNGTGGQISAGPTYSYNGPWSDATPYVIGNSQNYNFAHLAGSGFTNAGPAEYEIIFTARDASTNAVVATTTIFAEVVPEPASIGLIALGGVALIRRRRASR